jgi:hypothetical protein
MAYTWRDCEILRKLSEKLESVPKIEQVISRIQAMSQYARYVVQKICLAEIAFNVIN